MRIIRSSIKPHESHNSMTLCLSNVSNVTSAWYNNNNNNSNTTEIYTVQMYEIMSAQNRIVVHNVI